VSELSGVLPVDKPVGPTSHDLVAMARRALGLPRIGHTGTLDPFASGLLLLCLGPATRLAEYLTARPKTYLATMRLGTSTDTDDLTGAVVASSEGWRDLSGADIDAALARQVGAIEQLPPVYSAKKVGGERAHRTARRGGEVERRPVRVTLYSLEVREVSLPEVTFEVTCSAGTYVRAIARDAGETLGVGAHLVGLRRTRIGDLDVAGAVSREELESPERVAGALLTPLQAVSHLPSLRVDDATAARVRHGNAVALAAPEGLVALATEAGELLAIAQAGEGTVRPKKVLG
jgi:tRNA pseudouridine55 synthase